MSTAFPYPPLRVGMIGVGGHARQILIPAIEQQPQELALVALATAHEDTARAMSARYRLPGVVGHEALITRSDVEAVVVASRDHEPHAIAALEAGKHVFCETPGIRTRDGAARIRDLTRRKGLVYQVGYCLRYAPVYVQLRERLQESRREAPGPRTISARYYPAVGHFQNLLLSLGGAITDVLTIEHADKSGGISLFRFAGGDLGLIAWSAFHNVSIAYELLEVVHASGRLLAEDGRLLRCDRTPSERAGHAYALSFEQADAQLFQPTFSIPYGHNEQLYLRGYRPELADFARCVREGRTPVSDVEEAERTFLVGQAVSRSAAGGGSWTAVER